MDLEEVAAAVWLFSNKAIVERAALEAEDEVALVVAYVWCQLLLDWYGRMSMPRLSGSGPVDWMMGSPLSATAWKATMPPSASMFSDTLMLVGWVLQKVEKTPMGEDMVVTVVAVGLKLHDTGLLICCSTSCAEKFPHVPSVSDTTALSQHRVRRRGQNIAEERGYAVSPQCACFDDMYITGVSCLRENRRTTV